MFLRNRGLWTVAEGTSGSRRTWVGARASAQRLDLTPQDRKTNQK